MEVAFYLANMQITFSQKFSCVSWEDMSQWEVFGFKTTGFESWVCH